MMSVFEQSSAKLAAAAAAMDDADPTVLDAALGELDVEDWAELERLIGTASTRSVRSSRSRQAREPLGDVILLPGIMGTDLGIIGTDGLPQLLWFNLLALRNGGLAKLRMPLDGSPSPYDIVVGGPLKLFYLPLQMKLNQQWRARMFPYDWREDVWRTADRLRSEIDGIDSPTVHLVAHSMGGLVSRAMIAGHPDVWDRMGGRLVMLGTPNRGSFAPVLALSGKDRKLRLLALLDARLSSRDVTDVVATFPGLLQMLPALGAGVEPPVDALYDRDGWPGTPVDQRLLDLARETHERLEGAVDPPRMVYIAGYGHQTVDAVERKNGRFRYRRSVRGDGTVPHSLGLLPGVPTFWTRAKHGALAKDDAVLMAIDDLLLGGTTDRLVRGFRAPADRGEPDERWVDDDDIEREVVEAVGRAHSIGRDIDLLDDVLPGSTAAGVQVPIRIEVVWAGVATIAADVVAVGHYQDVFPTAAELALDEAISGAEDDRRRMLHAATARGALKGALGDVFVVPWRREDGRQMSAMVLGMGRPGTFTLPQHEVLVRNLVWTAERVLDAKSAACVLIGAGAGNLSIEAAVANFVRSLDAAARESELTGRLQLIRIVEVELGRARRILDTLRRTVEARDRGAGPAVIDLISELGEEAGGIVSVETALGGLLQDVRTDAGASLRDRVARVEMSERARQAMCEALERRAEPQDGDEETYVVSRDRSSALRSVPTRLSVLEVGGVLVASAVSDAATVPERDFGLDVALFSQLVELANAQAAGDPTIAGQMLLRVGIRPEFRPLLELDRDIVIEVDSVTAALPWEVLGSASDAPIQLEPLGLRTPLARQLRTRHSPPPVVTGRVVLTRALVIGDPTGGSHRLPGAEREALAVAEALYDHQVAFDLLLGPKGMTDPEQRWHASPATLANVLHRLLHEEYQLVHYAGHGTFAADDPTAGTGWVLADGLLTGNHLKIIERLPPLLVANACHSSRVSTNLPGLADDFMGRGVRNLVGTARTVGDESARQFAETFYSRLLGPRPGGQRGAAPTLGNAVLAGRRELSDLNLPDWDVYQLYGDPSFRFWPDALGRET